MNPRSLFFPEIRFGNFTNIDGTIMFYNRVNSLLQKSMVLLDVGCGRGEYGDDLVEYRRNLRIFIGKVSKVIGIDVSNAGVDNPFLDEFRQIIGLDWPVESGSIDIIICDWVVEHVGDIDKFFSEAKRVLRKDGIICIRTTNKWHYISFFSRLFPEKYHNRVLSLAQSQRKEVDVFPAVYHCNTISSLKKSLNNSGFEDSVVFGYEAEPSYLSFSRFVYAIGVIYQKIMPQYFKSTIIAIAKK